MLLETFSAKDVVGTHKTSDSAKCDYYTPPLDHVQAFTNGPLSNFNRCPIHMGPLTFETSEHAYQFRACEEHLRPDIAEQVIKAKIHGRLSI